MFDLYAQEATILRIERAGGRRVWSQGSQGKKEPGSSIRSRLQGVSSSLDDVGQDHGGVQ